MTRFVVTSTSRFMVLAGLVVLFAARSSDAWIYKSTNGGANWSRVSGDPRVLEAVRILPVEGDLYVATRSGLFKSGDGGVGWTELTNGLPPALAEDLDLGAAGHVVVATNRGLFESADDGSSWQPLVTGLEDRYVTGFGYAPLAWSGLYVATVVNEDDKGIYRLLPNDDDWNDSWLQLAGWQTWAWDVAGGGDYAWVGYPCFGDTPLPGCAGVAIVHDDFPMEADCVIPYGCWHEFWVGLPNQEYGLGVSRVYATGLGTDRYAVHTLGVYHDSGSISYEEGVPWGDWSYEGLGEDTLISLLPSASGGLDGTLAGVFGGVLRRDGANWVDSSAGLPPDVWPTDLVRDPDSSSTIWAASWDLEPKLLVPDGSFELGPPPDSRWTTTTSSPCKDTGIGNWSWHGSWGFWGGGYVGCVDPWPGVWSRKAEQSVLIPAGEAELSFWFTTFRDQNGPDDPPGTDEAFVQINGVDKWVKDISAVSSNMGLYYSGGAGEYSEAWARGAISIAAYAGSTVTLTVGYRSPEGDDSVGNVVFDFIGFPRAPEFLVGDGFEDGTFGAWIVVGGEGVGTSSSRAKSIDRRVSWWQSRGRSPAQSARVRPMLVNPLATAASTTRR